MKKCPKDEIFIPEIDACIHLPTINRLLLSNRTEEPKYSDYGKFDIIPDKIWTADEGAYESIFTVNNKRDAITAKKVIEEASMRIFGVKIPVRFRRYYQNQPVYEIYTNRWLVETKDGKLIEWQSYKEPEEKWRQYRREINTKIGKVYTPESL